MSRREDITRGMRMTGAAYTADDPRKATIRKGAHLTSTPRTGNEALIKSFPEFEDTIRAAGPTSGPEYDRHAAAVQEIARRLQAVRDQLEAFKRSHGK